MANYGYVTFKQMNTLQNNISSYRFTETGKSVEDNKFLLVGYYTTEGNQPDHLRQKEEPVIIFKLKSGKWVISRHYDLGSCFNKEYMIWEIGSVSSQECQFDSAEEAYAFIKSCCDKLGSTLQ